MVSVGTNSLVSCSLSHDADHSLFPSLPLTGIVFELLTIAVTLFATHLKKYNVMNYQNKYYDLSYKTLLRIGYSMYNIITI